MPMTAKLSTGDWEELIGGLAGEVAKVAAREFDELSASRKPMRDGGIR